MSKTLTYQPKFVSSPSYRKSHSRANKLFRVFLALALWSAVIIGGVWAN